jgi:hypothetical protein
VLLALGTVVAFFGTGIFSGSGIMGSEIFPTAVRARALSSVAPLVIGRVGQTKGLSWAFYLCAAGYFAGRVDVDAVARNEGEEAGLTDRLPQTVAFLGGGRPRKITAAWDLRATIGNRRATTGFLRIAVAHRFCGGSHFGTIAKLDCASIANRAVTRWDRLRPILDSWRRAPAAAQ